jgi:hypothetical protein
MITAPLLLAAALAASAAPAISTAAAKNESVGVVAGSVSAGEPVVAGGKSVAQLKEDFLAATKDEDRGVLLGKIARTAPVTAQDISALFDLFSRFPDQNLRKGVMDSLALLQPENPQLEPVFVTYLQQSEPEAQLFGINGAFRLRSREALPMVRKIAKRRFKAPSPESINALSERNKWSTQYEALSALAQWEGAKALPLLREKAKEAPGVAFLLGQHFWVETFPDLLKWAASKKAADHDRAVMASRAPISLEAARATRDRMLAYLRDPNSDEEIRHRFALKVGACSHDDEVDALIQEHDKAPNDAMRLVWAAAVFAAHSPNSIPLIVRYARESPDETARAGARTELVNLVGEARARELLGDGKEVKK